MEEIVQHSQKLLRIGDVAPDFSARSTTGSLRLSDYRGRWLIFFSHPADFTPVCTTEFVALTKLASEFEKADCALLGLSVDSLYSHLAWLRAIENRFDVEVDFPVLEDPSMAIGHAYGMIDEGTTDSSTMRSTYYIDPKGVIRAQTTYPHTVGRSAAEMLRLLLALQTAEKTGLFTPEGWQPGDALLKPPPATLEDVNEQEDWFCQMETTK